MTQLITPVVVTKTIDGLEFGTVPFPALHALGLMPRLAQLGSAFGGADEGVSLDPKAMQSLLVDLLRQTWVMIDDGGAQGQRKIEISNQVKFDQVFTGRLPTVFKVVQFVQEVNFGGFSDGGKNETGVLLPAA